MARKNLEAGDITVIIDTREQDPWVFQHVGTQPGTLPTGDYSVLGLEKVIAVERKSLQDLIGCVGRERERFEREVQRLLAYPVRLVVVEASWSELGAGTWRGKITPTQATAAVLGWMARGVPFLFCRRDEAPREVARFMFIAARRRWREAQGLVEGLKVG